ncbi:MAG TPA: hypothetical protein VK915_11385 [Gaiellaceae bacterium]|nr:hypothetical protein [Gaiellaceae bacterium]
MAQTTHTADEVEVVLGDRPGALVVLEAGRPPAVHLAGGTSGADALAQLGRRGSNPRPSAWGR